MSGAIDAVLVTRADRLGRDAVDLMQTRALFQGLGILQLLGAFEAMDDDFSRALRCW